ncbi:acyltransferase family protein [Sphaerotilus microaerophilus]|uniref:acyltransferase family protein n=1 Tax=Sphaerotilus microaerophilus TaxID=2914710 RepID=UPI002073D76E|nr:acyltransferase [Sphaerotilus sp. FB-5]
MKSFDLSLNFNGYAARRFFGSLDGLRAISIIAVIWHHTAPTGTPSLLAHLGGHGVTLFFSISGFLITTLLLREWRKGGAIDLKAFYLRRTLRIFPLYYTVILIYVVLVYALERHSAAGQAFFVNLPYFLSYTSNLFVALDGRTIFYFAWSLAAEEQFYLIWPAVLLLCRAPARAAWVLVAVAILATVGQVMGAYFAHKVPVAIVIGSLLAILLDREGTFRLVAAVLGGRWAAPAALVLVVACASSSSLPPACLHTALAMFVGACVVREDHLLSTLLTNRWARYIGEISYGMYLLHMLCKNLAAKSLGAVGVDPDSAALFAATVVLTTVLARLSFKHYESYFLKLKERYTVDR